VELPSPEATDTLKTRSTAVPTVWTPTAISAMFAVTSVEIRLTSSMICWIWTEDSFTETELVSTFPERSSWSARNPRTAWVPAWMEPRVCRICSNDRLTSRILASTASKLDRVSSLARETDCVPFELALQGGRSRKSVIKNDGAISSSDAGLVILSRLPVEIFLESHEAEPYQIVLDFDSSDIPLHGKREGRFFHGYYDEYR